MRRFGNSTYSRVVSDDRQARVRLKIGRREACGLRRSEGVQRAPEVTPDAVWASMTLTEAP